MAMSATDLKKWAREELRDAIDEKIECMIEHEYTLDFDDIAALKKERNRIAKFLGFQEKE
jgi:hypothetical protein